MSHSWTNNEKFEMQIYNLLKKILKRVKKYILNFFNLKSNFLFTNFVRTIEAPKNYMNSVLSMMKMNSGVKVQKILFIKY